MSAASSFSGYLGTEILQQNKEDWIEYNVFYRFDTLEHFHRWNDSPTRSKILSELHQKTLSSKKFLISGLETWFTLTSDQPLIAPPKYKMLITTWVGVYGLLLILFSSFGKYLIPLPMPLRFLLLSLAIVTLMTYFVMPFLTKVLAKWLYPEDKKSERAR